MERLMYLIISVIILASYDIQLNVNEQIQMEIKQATHEAEMDLVLNVSKGINKSKRYNEIKIEYQKYLEEYEMLAHLINGEAGSNWCDYDMLLLTGSVVLNRIEHEKYPNTMKEVIFQKGQYSCVRKGGAYYLEPSERCYKAAEELLRDGPVAPPNVVFQANFIQGKGVYRKVQNMYFCYK